MITLSKNLLIGGSMGRADQETPIYVNIFHYGAQNSYSMGLWLTIPQAQDLAAHISALTRLEPEND